MKNSITVLFADDFNNYYKYYFYVSECSEQLTGFINFRKTLFWLGVRLKSSDLHTCRPSTYVKFLSFGT